MPNQRRDSTAHLLPRKSSLLQVEEDLNSQAVRVSDSSTSTGAVATADAFFSDDTADYYTNGNILVGIHTLGRQFTFSTWVWVSTATQHILLDVDNTFRIVLDTSVQTLILRRRVHSAIWEEFSVPFPVTLSQWTYVTVARNHNTVKVSKDLVEQGTLSDYYYDIPSAPVRFGLTFTGRMYRQHLYLKRKDLPGILSDTSAIKTKPSTLTRASENAESKILDLFDRELVSSSNIYPIRGGSTYYNSLESFWKVTRAISTTNFRSSTEGLVILPPSSIKLKFPFTIEVGFKIPSLTSNIVLASQWDSTNTRSWFLWYEISTNTVKFNYLDKATNIVNQVNLGTYTANSINHFSLTASTNDLCLFFNGKLIQTLSVSLVKAHRFSFNYDNSLVVNTGNFFELHKFTVSSMLKYLSSYLPNKGSRDYKYIPSKSSMFNYHFNDEVMLNKRKPIDKVMLTGTSTLYVGYQYIYHVSIPNALTEQKTVRLEVRFPDNSDLAVGDVTFPGTVTFLPGETSKTIQVGTTYFPVNPYKNKFSLIAFSSNSHFKLDIDLLDYRAFNLNSITSLNGYIDGYLTLNSTVAGTIPNLTNTANATTTASRVVTIHGVGYAVISTATALTFPAASNVRTAIVIYRELTATANRGYLGNLSTYTFNGGTANELVGTPVKVNVNDNPSQPIIAVRQNYANAATSDALLTFEPQILTFYSDTALTASHIGRTNSSCTLNGVVYGWLLFDRILTSEEAIMVEDTLKKHLKFGKYSLYV